MEIFLALLTLMFIGFVVEIAARSNRKNAAPRRAGQNHNQKYAAQPDARNDPPNREVVVKHVYVDEEGNPISKDVVRRLAQRQGQSSEPVTGANTITPSSLGPRRSRTPTTGTEIFSVQYTHSDERSPQIRINAWDDIATSEREPWEDDPRIQNIRATRD